MNVHTPSGIHLSDEEHVVYQTDQMVRAVEVKYYWAQMYLRITLNSIHNQLYDKNAQSEHTSTLLPGTVCTAFATHADRF